MAKLTRYTQKIFAGSASDNGQFGSLQLGTKVTSNDLSVLQSLAAYSSGWLSATLSGQLLPSLEEMQALNYIDTYQLAYIFENGIPEWDSGTTYYQYSIVKKTGTYELYGSLIDSNLNHALPSKVNDSNWKYLGDLSLLKKDYLDNITANSSGTQGSATQLVNGLNRISTCAGFGYSVKLPSIFDIYNETTVINDGVYSTKIFPYSGDYINNLAVDTAFILPAGGRVTFVATVSNSNWRIKSSYQSVGTYSGITAYAGGGQTNAIILNFGTNIVSTVATALDSVKLPASFELTDSIVVTNKGAKVLNIYPASGHDLGKGTNNPYPLLPNNSLMFNPVTANTTWQTIQNGWQESPEQTISLSSSLAGMAVVKAIGHIKYSTSGTWRINFNFMATCNAVSRTSGAFTIIGVLFEATTNNKQAISGYPWDTFSIMRGAFVNENSNTLTIGHDSYSTTGYSCSGEVALNAMPDSTFGGSF